jgi:hypothetical protein
MNLSFLMSTMLVSCFFNDVACTSSDFKVNMTFYRI